DRRGGGRRRGGARRGGRRSRGRFGRRGGRRRRGWCLGRRAAGRGRRRARGGRGGGRGGRRRRRNGVGLELVGAPVVVGARPRPRVRRGRVVHAGVPVRVARRLAARPGVRRVDGRG